MVIFGKETKAHFISLYICYLSLHLYPLPYSGLMFFVCSFDGFQGKPKHWRMCGPLCYKSGSMWARGFFSVVYYWIIELSWKNTSRSTRERHCFDVVAHNVWDSSWSCWLLCDVTHWVGTRVMGWDAVHVFLVVSCLNRNPTWNPETRSSAEKLPIKETTSRFLV